MKVLETRMEEDQKEKMEERIHGGEKRVKHHEGESSNCEITTDYVNDLLNICSWLIECPSKTLMIESDDCKTESEPRNEVNFIHDFKNTKKDIEYLDKHDSLVGKELKEEHQEGNESTGENPSVPNGEDMMCELREEKKHQHLINHNHKETELITIYGENDKFDGGKKHIESPTENENLPLQEGKSLEEADDDDEVEEYYLIEEEELIEDDENEEATGEDEFKKTGEDELKRTGEDKKEERVEENKNKELKRRQKRREYEVFVGGLDWRATKEDICKVFSRTGEVQSVRMAVDPLTKENRGYAFVRYTTVEQARLALTKLKNPLVRGRRCEVTASHENDTLFLGNICKTWTKEHLRATLERYGINNYKELALIEDERNKGMNKGFAFLEFWGLPDARRVYEVLHKSHLVLGTPHTVKVSFAIFDEQYPQIMAKVTTVFIDGLSPRWEEDYVRSCLEKYGTIENVRLAKHMKTAKRLDFGYVIFDSHENALKCIQGVNDRGIIGKGHQKVKVRTALCRPLNKPRFRNELKSNIRIRSGAKSSFDKHISNSPAPPERLPARISKRVPESRFSPLRGRESKRPNRLMDLDPLRRGSKRSRCVYSPERAYKRIRTPPDSENYQERIISREQYNKRSDYSSNYITERRYYRDEDYYSCNDACKEKCCEIMPSYDGEGRIHKFHKSGGSMCQYEDDGSNMYDESSICRSKSRLDYDIRGCSSCTWAPSADSCSQRHGRSHLAYRTNVSFREEMYNSHDDMDYREGSVCTDKLRAYQSRTSSKCSSHGGPYVGGSLCSSLRSDSSFCCDTFQGCRCGIKREY